MFYISKSNKMNLVQNKQPQFLHFDCIMEAHILALFGKETRFTKALTQNLNLRQLIVYFSILSFQYIETCFLPFWDRISCFRVNKIKHYCMTLTVCISGLVKQYPSLSIDLQYKKMHLAIELAGGKPVLLESKIADKHLIADQSVLMTCTETECNQSLTSWLTHVQDLLER